MTKTTSARETDRQGVRRRSVGLLVGAVICAAPLAAAPAASAQTGSDPLGGLGHVLGTTVQALPNTLGDPLGGPNVPGRPSACTQLAGIGPFLTCLIDRLDKALGGQSAQARVKARVKTRVLRGTNGSRWTSRY
jgi:hypothetical protein